MPDYDVFSLLEFRKRTARSHAIKKNRNCKRKSHEIQDNFDFATVNFLFLDGAVPRSTSYGVYISQLIHFARVSRHVDDYNIRNKVLTAKLFRQGKDIIHFVLRFQNFIGGMLSQRLNIMSD